MESLPMPAPRDNVGRVVFSSTAQTTLSDALDRFCRVKASRWSPGYADRVASVVKAWLEILPSMPVSQIGTIDIEELYMARNDGSRGPAGLNWDRKVLKCFWRWLSKHKVVSEDPTDFWPHLEEVTQRAYYSYSKELEDRMLSALVPPRGKRPDPRWGRIKPKRRIAIAKFLVLAIRMGLRKALVKKGRWDWVADDWILTIPAKFMKTRKPLRLPMPSRAIEILGARGAPEDLLVPDLPCMSGINRAFKRLARICGIDPKICYPHQCRRTMVGRLLEAGVPDAHIQKLGQWSQAEIMRKHYTCGLKDKVARDILEKI